MAIQSIDLKKYLTGATLDGGSQSDPNASLGNYRSSSEIPSGNDNNLFDDVTGPEAQAGDTEYRCLVFKNTHGTLALTNARIFVSADDSNADTTYYLAVERPAAANPTGGNAQTIANESTAPTVNATDHNGPGSGVSDWVVSTSCNSYANGIPVNEGSHDTDLDVGELIFVWIKRVIGASASAASAVSFTVTLQGDTAA